MVLATHTLTLELQHYGFEDPSDDGVQEGLEYVQVTRFNADEFLFVNLIEGDTPYNRPQKYQSMDTRFDVGCTSVLTDSVLDPETLRGAYDDRVDCLLDVYRKISKGLSSVFNYVITVSDHGEIFGEHSIFVHLPPSARSR